MTYAAKTTKTAAALIAAFALLTSCGSQKVPAAQSTAPVLDSQQGRVTPNVNANANANAAAKTDKKDNTPNPNANAAANAPLVHMVTTPALLTKEGSVLFFVGSTDKSGRGLAKTEVLIDGQAFVSDEHALNSYGKYFTAAQNGKHIVKVTVTDKAGRSASAEQEFTVDIAQ